MKRFDVTFFELISYLREEDKKEISANTLMKMLDNWEKIDHKDYHYLYYKILEIDLHRWAFSNVPKIDKKRRQRIKYAMLWQSKGHLCNYGGESNRRHKNTEYFR